MRDAVPTIPPLTLVSTLFLIADKKGMNELWWCGKARGGQGRAGQDRAAHHTGRRLSQRTWPRRHAAQAFGDRFLCGRGGSSRALGARSSCMAAVVVVELEVGGRDDEEEEEEEELQN